MGKQQRNKRQRRNKDKEKSKDADGSSSALLQRLRHSDEATRHAALAAIELHPSLLQSQPRLLEAVRDQLMGQSLATAAQASACMIAYLSLDNFNEDVTAGWMALLIRRLETCLALEQKSLTSIDLSAKCLDCLGLLTEVNPLAMRRILRSQVDVLSVLCPWLEEHPPSNELLPSLAARCLHSTLDDNRDLVLPWFALDLERQSQPRRTLQALENVINSTTNVSAITQLHAVGAWLSVWRMIPHCNSINNKRPLATWLESQLEPCIRVLMSHSEGLPHSVSSLLARLQTTHDQWIRFQQDMLLENEVIASQEAKKEPARSIARRLKKQQEEKDAMQVDQAEESNNEQALAGSHDDKPDDVPLSWDKIQSEWHSTMRPFQLALEILINLTTIGGSDDESIMSDAEVTLSLPLSTLLVEYNVPKQIQSLLTSSVALIQPPATASVSNCTVNQSLPQVATATFGDLVNKAGTGMGHVLSHLSQWHPPSSLWKELVTLFQQFLANVETAGVPMTTTENIREQDVDFDYCSIDCLEGISTAMVMGLQAKRFHDISLDTVAPLMVQALDHLKHRSPLVIRNVVGMLGLLLCGTTHTAKLNFEVCRALLQLTEAPNTPSMISAEVCNVLMDIYGSDDCHKQVFEELNVLNYFQRSIPLLQRDDEETSLNAERFIQYMTST